MILSTRRMSTANVRLAAALNHLLDKEGTPYTMRSSSCPVVSRWSPLSTPVNTPVNPDGGASPEPKFTLFLESLNSH